jgi:hypothetical protein
MEQSARNVKRRFLLALSAWRFALCFFKLSPSIGDTPMAAVWACNIGISGYKGFS